MSASLYSPKHCSGMLDRYEWQTEVLHCCGDEGCINFKMIQDCEWSVEEMPLCGGIN